MRFETLAVHTASEKDPATGAVAPPIHLSTTFEHGPAGEIPRGFMYIREGNPTQERLEEALATLDSGEAALALASGLAACSAILQSLPEGAHVLYPDDVYYGVRAMAKEFLPRWKMDSAAVDMGDPANVRQALRPNTKLIWAETPSNPLMKIADLAALAEIARGAGALLVVDGTFASPALQRPLELGADAVVHSTTKYFGGHSDVQGGSIAFRERGELFEKAQHIRYILGAVASPFNSWLVLRGIRTLACRVETQSANAMAVARALAENAKVEAVYYPGLESHPGHEAAKRQMRGGFGGMLSFRVRGGRDAAVRVASRVRVFVNATSLGGTESLLEHRASSEGPTSTTPQDLLRVSVGLEHPDDLIDDLRQALG